MGELLRIDRVSYSYHSLEGETPALRDVSLHVNDGEFLAIVGPSGCGKSTLLSLIAGLISPDTGGIYINNKDIKSSGKNIGYMLQKDHLLEWRSTLRNLTLGLEIQHKLTENSYVLINDMLTTYGLITFKNARPSELSGGMRQRAALIRTLLLEPDILLLDEPFSALDYQTRIEVSDDIWGIIRKEKKTAILITHDISEAISMADRIIVFTPRPGTVKRVINVNLTVEEKTPFRSRSAPEFKDYFNLIWKELSHHEVK
ncbi:MAG: Bicarbonate transport ATP-binding protein CmpD [Lachnoclostridium sp.]|jgi:NitT/TauT family transport system ATP-binding protein